jgi:hypothetical protein
MRRTIDDNNGAIILERSLLAQSINCLISFDRFRGLVGRNHLLGFHSGQTVTGSAGPRERFDLARAVAQALRVSTTMLAVPHTRS